MIPLRDVIPSRTVPIVTVTIVTLNALAFLFEWSLAPPVLNAFIRDFGFVPTTFAWSTILTSMFLHGGWLHVIGNMWYLWIFGDNVEDRLGHVRFALFYILCGSVAALAQATINPDSNVPMVGASGAIAGVMGAYFVLFPRSRVLTLVPLLLFWEVIELPAVFLLGFWFLIQFASGVGSIAATTSGDVGGVAFWAHTAGFLAGATGIFAFRRRDRERVEWWERRR